MSLIIAIGKVPYAGLGVSTLDWPEVLGTPHAPYIRRTESGKLTMLRHSLTHDRLIVRFVALLAVVSVVFVGMWSASYWLLPEGLLAGRTGAAVFAGNDLAGGSVWLEWIRIFVFNLAVTLLILVPANLLIGKRGYPLGYMAVVLIAAGFAMTLGTNSFTIPMPVRMPPSLGAFGSSGVYEIMAYVLVVAATTSIGRWRIKRWWAIRGTTERVRPLKDKLTITERNVGVVLAFALLVSASALEAIQIAAALV